MADSEIVRVLGFSGSLRKESYNGAALRAAAELAPEGMVIETVDLSPIPLYNDDVYQRGFPPGVQDFRARISAADAVLIATPEYNYSVPGVLKNAIDWVSRPPDQPFNGKPLALMGASTGRFGTARGQYHLRQVFVFLNAHILNKPEVMITDARAKFDARGRLIDEPTRGFIRDLLVALRDWTLRLRAGSD